MESCVQPLEKTRYPAAGTKISACAADSAFPDLSGAGLYWNQNRPELNLVCREEICEVELIPKTSLDGMEDMDAGRDGKGNAAGEAASAKEQDIYGVRLNLEALEVQFYHRIDSVQRK